MKGIETIQRKRIDPHKLYGVVVAESDQLALIHNNDDFQFDGYVVVRKKDITKRYVSEGTAHVTKIMKKEGLWESPSQNVKQLSLDSWASLLNRFVGKVVILENERADDFYIGPVMEVQRTTVVIHYLDCDGKLLLPERVPFSKITLMKFGDRYSTLHAKYMEKAHHMPSPLSWQGGKPSPGCTS